MITKLAALPRQWAVHLLSATAIVVAIAPQTASGVPHNRATYQVTLSGVQAPNKGQTNIPGASGDQSQYQYSYTPAVPGPVEAYGSADTGTNQNGYGYAVGHGFARAEAGILKAMVMTEAQAVAQPGSNVGAGVTAKALAEFEDKAVFTAASGTYQNLLIISGTLQLAGDFYGNGSFGEIHVGGTGLNSQDTFAEWIGDSNGRVKNPYGVFGSWVPGTPVSIPFSFTVYAGQQTSLSYWLQASASSGASFQPCAASGGLCSVIQTVDNSMTVDYSHSLAWGGVTAKDWFGKPVAFSVASTSGFNYAAAAVPEPASWGLMLCGVALTGFIARRRALLPGN